MKMCEAAMGIGGGAGKPYKRLHLLPATLVAAHELPAAVQGMRRVAGHVCEQD